MLNLLLFLTEKNPFLMYFSECYDILLISGGTFKHDTAKNFNAQHLKYGVLYIIYTKSLHSAH